MLASATVAVTILALASLGSATHICLLTFAVESFLESQKYSHCHCHWCFWDSILPLQTPLQVLLNANLQKCSHQEQWLSLMYLLWLHFAMKLKHNCFVESYMEIKVQPLLFPQMFL
jgi:hypothetical protein